MIDEALAGKQHFDAVMGLGIGGILVIAGIFMMLLFNQGLIGIGAIIVGIFAHSMQ